MLLDAETLKQAIELKIACWLEQLAGVAENNLLFAEENAFRLDWMHTAKKHKDTKTLVGMASNLDLLK